MILSDVNVLVYAYREESERHDEFHRWLRELVASDSPFALADVVVSGFLRIVTHPRIFDPPAPMERALAFVQSLREQPNCVMVAPAARHWDIFSRLCRAAGVRGNLVSDAYIAALAIETGSELATTDRDYSRFPGLLWRHPLA